MSYKTSIYAVLRVIYARVTESFARSERCLEIAQLYINLYFSLMHLEPTKEDVYAVYKKLSLGDRRSVLP